METKAVAFCKNRVKVVGIVSAGLEFDHENKYNKVYKFMVQIPRTSGTVDELPVWISDKVLQDVGGLIEVGKKYEICGEYRSYNEAETGKLLLVVFAKDLYECEAEQQEETNNKIELEGYIVKALEPRTTPSGRRILDIFVAVNRYKKSSYIPCIVWSPTKHMVDALKVGEKVSVKGRIQSREYTKNHPDGMSEIKTAYEVSVARINAIEETE